MEFNLGQFLPVADRVWRAVAHPAAVNIGLVVGGAGALVVDTGSSPAQGRAIREAARAVAGGVPLTHVVVTHAHYDHLLGLAAFSDLVTVGHRGLAGGRPSADDLAAVGVRDAEVVAPSRTFGLAVTVDLGDCHVEIVHFGRGHTDHDAVVIVPGRGVVFAGDLLESSAPPSAGADAWPAEWPATLDGTLGTLRRDTVIVPGHGDALSREDAFLQRSEIAWYNGKAVELYDAGGTASGAWTTQGDWPWPAEASEQFLAVAMRRLAESGRPRKRPLPLLGR
ncbi:MAG: MBL fold metallo-hydrolase [Actinomycetes bacterium]